MWIDDLELYETRIPTSADLTGKQLQASLSGALAENLKLHAQTIAASEQSLAERNHRHWAQVQRSLVQSSEATSALQKGIAGQADVLTRAVEAAAEVARLEDSLNKNLAALAGSKNFEQTVMSLAAAIHLLNARLGEAPVDARSVRLEPTRQAGHAA